MQSIPLNTYTHRHEHRNMPIDKNKQMNMMVELNTEHIPSYETKMRKKICNNIRLYLTNKSTAVNCTN